MTTRSTKNYYIQCIGESAVDVTQSCHLVRYKKYALLLDCGLYQCNDVPVSYKVNQRLLKKIKPQYIDYIILTHCHADHIGMLPALYSPSYSCHAHIYVPKGSIPFLKLMWEDSMKIMESDCKKYKLKCNPFYTQEDIERTLNRCIEVDYFETGGIYLNPEIQLTLYPAGHIINSAQVVLTFHDGYITKRVGYTGDISGRTDNHYVALRETLPFVDVLLGENTYNRPKARKSKDYDRQLDVDKIVSVVNNSRRVLIPCFALQRTQEILTQLFYLRAQNKISKDIPIYIDSPLAHKICDVWPDPMISKILEEDKEIQFVDLYSQSAAYQRMNKKCIVLSGSGFMTGGRILGWLKTILPCPEDTILFCGYSGENNLASQIRSKQSFVEVENDWYPNKANIIELTSFSSHSDYEDLIKYYTELCSFNKLGLVHGDMKYKPDFKDKIQDILVDKGCSARVICVNADQKINF